LARRNYVDTQQVLSRLGTTSVFGPALLASKSDATGSLKDADSADNAEVYGRLGLTLIYHPQDKRVGAETRPNSIRYVGACPRSDSQLMYMTRVTLSTEFVLAGAR
jgi:hypothetical protein